MIHSGDSRCCFCFHVLRKDKRPAAKTHVHCLSFLSQTMADKFQNEISVVMRGELTSVHFFKRTPHSRAIIICHCSYCPLKDKLTAELPVLRSREEGVPLPKVAAHVTGGSVSSFTEPPPADGEDTRWEFGKWMLALRGDAEPKRNAKCAETNRQETN